MAATSTPDARLLKAATTPEGLCATCAITAFFKFDTLGTNMQELMVDKDIATVLLDPRMQAMMVRVLETGKADARPEEIDWQWAVDHWDLPFPEPPPRARRKKTTHAP